MKKGLKLIQNTSRIVLLISGLIICLTGCGEQGPSVSITASPETINFDESTILTWSSHDADSVSINNGVGTVEKRGTTVVKPYRTTTYTICGVNADGQAESSVTVKINYSGPEPILNVSAYPTSIFPGESSMLTWSTTNAYSVSVDNGIGFVPLNGSMKVSPTVTTTYTFSAFGQGGEKTFRITIDVMSPTPTATITANPVQIKLGEESVLEWTYTNAETVTIEPGNIDATSSKSQAVSPTKTTTYTITAVGSDGRTATDHATVFVDEPVIYVEIHATPINIHSGECSELSWTTHNATRVWIEPGEGDVELTGTLSVCPQQNTKYVIYASNGNTTVTDSVTINVAIPDPPTVSISAHPSRIMPNETSLLTWQSQNATTVEIDQEIGTVALSGSKEVSPQDTTTYTIKATGPGGTAYSSVTITVYFEDKLRLGNQHFSIEKAAQVDPLAPYRLNTDLSKDTDRLILEKMDWSSKIPDVKDQQTTGSDNAWALAYYLRSFQENLSMQHASNAQVFSPMFTYVHQCKNETQPWNLIKTWKMMHRYGCTLWTSLPFEDLDGFMDENEIAAYNNYQIADSVISDAMRYRMGTPVVLNDLAQIRMMLTQSPVVLAINHFDPYLPVVSVSDDQNYLRYSDRSDVGHTVLCIGYDNKHLDTGALKIINSWGKEWADDGVSWIKYDDVNNIVVSALTFHALSGKSTEGSYEPDKPEQPQDVQATLDKGPYVDIQWTHVNNARYYQIYRAPEASLSTLHEVYDYEFIGTTMHSPYRDFPAAGDAYLYAIVAVNEFGSSEHLNHQNENKPHIAKGVASGKSLKTPAFSFESDPSAGKSEFCISGLDSDTSRLQVFVAQNEYGPWQSFGWIQPVDRFVIDWYKDNTWTGYQPYVRVVAENQLLGFSMASRAVRVSSPVVPQNQVATINSLNAQPSDLKTIQLSWSLAGDKVDFLEIWRTYDIQASSPTWIKLDTVSSALNSYHDGTAVSGINYQYAAHCVHEGIAGIATKSNITQLPLNQPNLRIVHVEYDTGALMEPFEMELTIENNGNTSIQDYSFKVIAYNWATSSNQAVCLEESISSYPELKTPLDPGSQHIFSITFDLPEQLNSGVLFSWFILIDSKHEVDEAYESDNVYWAQKMCWMEMEH
jgi:hypothetical protein